MFERFADESRSLVIRAQEYAREMASGYIGTEHLLMALMRSPSTRQLLADHGATEADFQRTLFPGEAHPSQHYPFTPRAKRVLERSLRESIRLSTGSILPEHILLGVLSDDEGKARRYLSDARVNVATLWKQIEAKLPESKRKSSRYTLGPEGGVVAGYRDLATSVVQSIQAGGPGKQAPLCPSCGSSLANNLRAERVKAISAGEQIHVWLCFCGDCGVAINAATDTPARGAEHG
jgi:ATP-dependent Clp protease ATP-binding subunit ClpA